MQQLLQCISYLHDHKIVHRDLKPENILCDSDSPNTRIKLIDFGTSCLFINDKNLEEIIGTPYYIAPEVFNHNYNNKCDEWSAGVILYIMLSGMPPFGGTSDEEIMKKIVKGS